MSQPDGLRRAPIHDLFLAGARPVPVTIAAIATIALFTVALAPFNDSVSRATLALLLVLPVIGAAALGGRVPGYVAAAGATLAFSLSLPPLGSPQVHLADDAVALVVFVVVALVASTLVTARIDALAQLERQRALLLRSVSHDLRTPLATIRAAASELLDGSDHDADAQRHLLRLVDVEAVRLDRLVGNLLTLNRIESGAMTPRRSSVDAVTLLHDAAEPFTLTPGRARVEVSVEEDLGTIDVDPTQMDQVLANLIDNAVRHSPDGGVVTVSGRRDDEAVELTVADRGPGVSPDEADLIFQPFRSGELAGSSGVGLAISRAIVEAHGGRISLEDRPGGGAAFTVRLARD